MRRQHLGVVLSGLKKSIKSDCVSLMEIGKADAHTETLKLLTDAPMMDMQKSQILKDLYGENDS